MGMIPSGGMPRADLKVSYCAIVFAITGSDFGNGLPASVRAVDTVTSAVGSTPGGATYPFPSGWAAAERPARYDWIGTPTGSGWVPSGTASPSELRPFG